MSDHPCCRIDRGKMLYEDIEGTGNKISDHPCCRINRVSLYVVQNSRQKYPLYGSVTNFKEMKQGKEIKRTKERTDERKRCCIGVLLVRSVIDKL